VHAVIIGGTNYDPSAILDIQSTEAGILVPRMSSEERELINSPAEGLFIYDSGKQSFMTYIR
jgi:hypothetical protein